MRLRARFVALAALTLLGGGLASTLTPSTALDTFVSAASPDYRSTQAMYRLFGGDPVVVLIRGPVGRLLSPGPIRTLARLEACLAGQQLGYAPGVAAYLPVPARQARPEGGWTSACGALMRARATAVLDGPATFLDQAVAAVNTEVGRVTVSAVRTIRAAETAARSLAGARGLDAAQTAAAVQAAGELALARVLATTAGGTATPGATGTAGATGTTTATQALLAGIPSIADPAFLRRIVFGPTGRRGATSPARTGAPSPRLAYLFPTARAAVIQVRLRAGLDEREQRRAIAWIRAAVARPSFRIPGFTATVTGEPVLLSDLGGEIAGELVRLLGLAIVVMALVLLAVLRRRLPLLPLLTALPAVAASVALAGLLGGRLTLADVAVCPVLLGLAVDYGVQLRSGTPRGATAVAALATAAGFLALLASPVPMVRGFGLLLVVGVVIACLLAVVAGPGLPGDRLGPSRRVPAPLAASVYGAGEILLDLIPGLLARPRRVLALGTALAAAGWMLGTATPVQTDITKLVPAGLPSLEHLRALERTTGTSGELDVLVSAADVTAPRTVAWMAAYERRMQARFGSGPCAARRIRLCPALSLPSLLEVAGGRLDAVPREVQRAVLTADHRHALLAFGVRLMPLARQRRMIEQMRAALHPPEGTHAALTGTPLLAADAEGLLADPARRVVMLLAGLALVGLALLAVLRRARRALTPLLPIVLASGWSALLVHLLRIPLNPMSATLGTLVIAITTEFSVLLSERVRAAGGRGRSRAQAIDDAYRTTGVAVLSSGLAAIAGFGVLAASSIPMVRDFGLLALVDLTVSLAGVLIVLPATLGLIDLRRP